jgi:cysteine-rich repeat protein
MTNHLRSFRPVLALITIAVCSVVARGSALAADACFKNISSPAAGIAVQGHIGASPHNVGYAGTFNIQIDNTGPTTFAYCVDILHSISQNDCEPQIPPTYPCEVVYILNSFYPNAAAVLSTAEEAAAVQSAIWFFTDSFVIDGPTNVKDRANAIIAAATGQCATVQAVPQTITLSPASAVNHIPPQSMHTVTATLFDTNGDPLPSYPITITVSGVSGPHTFSGTTDGAGQFTATYTNPFGPSGIGTDNISASASFSVPVGLEFKVTDKQGIVLAGAPRTGTVTGNATKTWAPAACGDGISGNTPGELCDDGNATNGDGCDNNCTPTACGNGILTAGEQCDDGNTMDGDGCDSNCTPTGCGNGVRTGSEQCDDGNATNGDGCDNNCTTTGCGNGVRTGSEQCDDANTTNGDGCDDNCTTTACGNGIVTGTEQCDDGNAVNGDGCDDNCTTTRCGNGVVTSGEECDDGNGVNGDGCDSNGTTSRCGNGIPAGSEQCDDGNAVDGDGCDSNCTIPACGNGVRAGSEECDDGNTTNGDGCDSNCTTSRCGNQVVAGSEQCDDGNTTAGDGCSPTCQIELCGNGVIDSGEACDDGNHDDSDACRSNCQPNVCGDGIVHTGVEECDDGNLVDDDTCRNDCTFNICGDGIVNVGIEQCDDGNVLDGDGCSHDCRLQEICNDLLDNDGDGLIDCEDTDCPPCPPILKDPAFLKFRAPGPDYAKIQGGMEAAAVPSLSPGTEQFGFLFTNPNGVLFRIVLPPGALQPRGTTAFKYFDANAKRIGGLFKVVLKLKHGVYHVTVKAYGDMSAATVPTMTVQVLIGDDVYFTHATWLRTKTGWKFEFVP